MKIDLTIMTRKELETLRDRIDVALARARKQDIKAATAAAEKAVKAYGLTLSDILDGMPAQNGKRGRRVTAKNPGTPKYANPQDRSQTWTGKGRRPDWFKEAVDAGKTTEDLEI